MKNYRDGETTKISRQPVEGPALYLARTHLKRMLRECITFPTNQEFVPPIKKVRTVLLFTPPESETDLSGACEDGAEPSRSPQEPLRDLSHLALQEMNW